ncbi:Signal peptide peptidase-like 1 [Ranunculus cassubicifolius]
MEPLWKLLYLFEPAPLTLILTAVTVTFLSAGFRILTRGKETERNREMADATLTLDGSQALMIPIMSSCSLLLMFYLFSSVSQILTLFTTASSVFGLFFCFSPFVTYFNTRIGLVDSYLSRCCGMAFTRNQGVLLLVCIGIVGTWLVSGHWMLNNLLGISICISFVSFVHLPNIKVCVLLLSCLFLYDIFWVYFSERLFGANVMVSVATQQASNPVHTVATSLSLPGLQLITKKIELPVKIVFPRNLFGGNVPGSSADFMMLGLGDMAIPGMLLEFVLRFDHRRSRDSVNPLDLSFLRGQKYIWYALPGYAIGLILALATGTLTRAPQPALLFLVPSTLGPIILISWMRKELPQLWEGVGMLPNEKDPEVEV